MPLTTRLATLADAETIGAIVDAMDRHYRGPDGASGVAASAAMVRRTMAEQEGTRFLLAFENETPVGIACFGILRPGRQLSGVIFLKDLFTLPEHRSRGVGRTLLRDLAHYAVEHGIGRIDFETDGANTGAQKLYDKLGGQRLEKIHYRFDGDRLARLARG